MNKDWIILLAISLFTSFVWVGFEIYQAATKIDTITIEEEKVEPIDPTLDSEALEILRSGGKNESNEATSSPDFRTP